MDMDTGLELWKEFIEFSPFAAGPDNWTSFCFFCGEEVPNHEPDCIFLKAKKLIESDIEYCNELSKGDKFVCTLAKGHAGQHMAHARQDIVVAMW
jgi:hypothetical protein